MLSKTDIQNELGKGICVYPLNLTNIKENSLNLCAGDYAWSSDGGVVYCDENEPDKNKRFSLSKDSNHCKEIKIAEKGKAIIESSTGDKYILLFPQSTTLIETAEVLAIGNNIGGTYHSKVGLVSKGLGHIGTMVGPNFSGDSLIAIHNISKNLIVLKSGESFVSVIFYHLKTKYTKSNPTVSGHVDKFAELGIQLSQDESSILNADWKKQYDSVKMKMCESSEYKKLRKIIKLQKKNSIKKFFNKQNVFITVVMIAVIVFLGVLAHNTDVKNGTTTWGDRFWNVFCSGLALSIISPIILWMNNNTID